MQPTRIIRVNFSKDLLTLSSYLNRLQNNCEKKGKIYKTLPDSVRPQFFLLIDFTKKL